MRKTRVSTQLLLSAAAFVFVGAQAQAATLSGTVSSQKEGLMEGVLVTAKKPGSTISVTVVTNEKGEYRFPDGRLEEGNHRLTIRAIGYILDGPRTVDVASGATVANLKLNATSNIAPQMTNLDWINSVPGSEAEKRDLVSCATCHTLQAPMHSHYTKEELINDLFPRMADMSSQAMPGLIQTRIVRRDQARTFGGLERLANFLSKVNLSAQAQHGFEYKTLPRPKGEATKVIITSYDLPRRTMQPHDTVMGDDGYVWLSNFGENSLSKLDPKTGKVTEFTYEQVRKGPYSNGNLDLEFDREGNIWLGMMNQTGAAKFDRKTETFTFYPIPEEMLDEETQTAMVAPVNSHIDGKIWINSAEKPRVSRFDIKTGTYEGWKVPWQGMGGTHSAYGVYTDSKNNAYLNDFPSHFIWKIDAETGKATAFVVPTERSRPRRGRMDSQDRLWFAEWWGDKVAMFDTKSGEFTEWKLPSKFSSPYDAQIDKEGKVWTGNMMDDRITRLDPTTGGTVEYLMPIETNLRRIAVDDYGARSALWVGAQHQAVVMKVEPLP